VARSCDQHRHSTSGSAAPRAGRAVLVRAGICRRSRVSRPTNGGSRAFVFARIGTGRVLGSLPCIRVRGWVHTTLSSRSTLTPLGKADSGLLSGRPTVRISTLLSSFLVGCWRGVSRLAARGQSAVAQASASVARHPFPAASYETWEYAASAVAALEPARRVAGRGCAASARPGSGPGRRERALPRGPWPIWCCASTAS
jgi:hypothetical protein